MSSLFMYLNVKILEAVGFILNPSWKMAWNILEWFKEGACYVFSMFTVLIFINQIGGSN